MQSLLFTIAGSHRRQLAAQVQYLKVENRMLRSRLGRSVRLSGRERKRLLRYGKPLGPAIKDIITIVTPRTFARWVSGERRCGRPGTGRPPGRPRTPEEIRGIVLRMARETGWGSLRIAGELKKLGITIARSTVQKILNEEGVDPAPERSPTWQEFIQMHGATLWACDYFSKRVITPRGLVTLYALVFINLQTRRVVVSEAVRHPSRSWAAKQAVDFVERIKHEPSLPPPAILLRDRDDKYGPPFDNALRESGVRVKPLKPRTPVLNAYAERWIKSLQEECLDHFVVFGKQHLDYLIREYVEHYHLERPHQGTGNVRIAPPRSALRLARDGPPQPDTIRCRTRLGGLLRSYEAVAA